MADSKGTTETDTRYRVIVSPDPDAQRPSDSDEYAPSVYRVDYRGGYVGELMGGAEVPGLADALSRWGRDDDRVDRYLRMFRDAVSVARGDTRDAHYLGIVTRENVADWGYDTSDRAKVDVLAVGYVAEWVLWAEGDVWMWEVQERVTWTTEADGYDDRDTWETVDSCGGYFGYDRAESDAREALAACVLEVTP